MSSSMQAPTIWMVGRVGQRTLKAAADDLGRRPDAVARVAPQLAHAFLVDEVVEIGAAHGLEDAESSAPQSVCASGLAITTARRETARAKRCGQRCVARVDERAEAVALRVEAPQPLAARARRPRNRCRRRRAGCRPAWIARRASSSVVHEHRIGAGEQHLVAQRRAAEVLVRQTMPTRRPPLADEQMRTSSLVDTALVILASSASTCRAMPASKSRG